MSISTKSVSLETEAENLNDEDQVNVSIVSEVHGLKRSKRMVKKSGGEGNAEKFCVKTVPTKQKLSVKTAEVSGALTITYLLLLQNYRHLVFLVLLRKCL